MQLSSSLVLTRSMTISTLNPIEQIALDKYLEEHLKFGRICSSKSPVASPLFVKKMDGCLRPVQDDHKLKNITIKTAIHFPSLCLRLHYTRCPVGHNNSRIAR